MHGFDPSQLQHGPPPMPAEPWEWQRWTHTALRRRILAGTWGPDLEQWLVQHLGSVRRQVTGPRDLSSNVLRTIVMQLSVLYDRGRLVTHASGPLPGFLATGSVELQKQGLEPLGTPPGLLARAGLWPLMQRVQRQVLGCNEYLVHVSWSRRGGLLYRPVAPDRVCAESLPERPDCPVRVSEARLWRHPKTGKTLWVWETHDTADLDKPFYEVKTVSAGPLGTPEVLLAFEGEKYPWRYETDEPFIPLVLYHREKSGELWDPYEGREVVDGTLTTAMLWTYFVHGVRDAAWAQRYVINAAPAGTAANADAGGEPPVSSLPSDPASIMVFETPDDLPPNATVQVGQWAAPFAPDMIGLAIARFEERLAQYVGVSPADLVRASGDPRSGYALAVSTAGLQNSQRKFAPQFEVGDAELIGKTAALLNLHREQRGGAPLLPEDGYQPSSPPAPTIVPGVEPGAPNPET